MMASQQVLATPPSSVRGECVRFRRGVRYDVPKGDRGGVCQAHPHKHIAAQLPTPTWKQKEYVRLDSTVSSPPKASAWAGRTSTKKQIQIVDFKKWLGGDINDVLPRMQAQWADQAAYDAAITDEVNDSSEAKLKKRRGRLIKWIDGLADQLRVLPA